MTNYTNEREREALIRKDAHHWFENHVAKMKNLGDVIIIDWQNVNGGSNHYVRYLFEEDECRLDISGDLGNYIVWNGYRGSNVCLNHMHEFVNDVYYFIQKIQTGKPIYVYDDELAKKDLCEYLELNDPDAELTSDERNDREALLNDLLYSMDWNYGWNFLEDDVIDRLEEIDSNYFEWLYSCGKVPSANVLQCLEGLKMAMQQLKIGRYAEK